MTTKQDPEGMNEILYLRLTRSEVEAIKQLAKANVRSAAAEMRVAVRQYIEANTEKPGHNGATH